MQTSSNPRLFFQGQSNFVFKKQKQKNPNKGIMGTLMWSAFKDGAHFRMPNIVSPAKLQNLALTL